MALTGSFKETPFADLLQLYSISKQTVAVSVTLPGSVRPDGVFYFDRGDLVAAFMSGTEGREAVRRALRLGDGKFRVDPGANPPDVSGRDALRHVVLEEVVKVDEERRAGKPAMGATATTNGSWEAVPPAVRAAPAGGPSPAPAHSAASAPGSRPSGGDGGGTGGGPRPAVPPSPPPPKSRVGLLLVAGLVVLAAVGGGGLWFASQHRTQPAPEATPAPASPAPAAAAPARGVTDSEIVLGMVASLSGSNKERGRAMRAGWEAALAAANAAGGVNGRKLRLVAYDDGYDPSRTLAAMKEVVEGQHAFAVVGNVGTATAAVAVPYCAQQKVVFFGALSGADLLRKTPPDRYVFNVRAGLATEAAAAVRYLVEVRRIPAKRVAVLAQDDDFGASGSGGAVRQLQTYGVAPGDVLRLSYARNTADVREALARLRERAGEVDGVVMVATYKPAATFVRKARDARLKQVFTAVSADSSGLAEELVQAGQGYTEDVILTQVVPVPTAGASALLRFRKTLEQYAPGEKFGSTQLEAWLGAQLLLEGLARAGRDLDTERLVAALEGIQGLDIGIGTPLTFGPQRHQASEKVWGWALKPDGSWRQLDLE